MTDLAARLAALREKGVELPDNIEFAECTYDLAVLVGSPTPIKAVPESLVTKALADLLTIIERQQEDAAMWRDLFLWADTNADKVYSIVHARLKLAEQRIAELEAQIEWWKGVLHRTNVEWKKDATKGRVQEERAEQAEARVEKAEAEVFEVLKRVDATERRAERAEDALAADNRGVTCPYCGDGMNSVGTLNHIECVMRLQAALAAERQKRCATCEYDPACNRTITIKTRWTPLLDYCSEHRPRNQVPNVAQPGDERDAEATT